MATLPSSSKLSVSHAQYERFLSPWTFAKPSKHYHRLLFVFTNRTCLTRAECTEKMKCCLIDVLLIQRSNTYNFSLVPRQLRRQIASPWPKFRKPVGSAPNASLPMVDPLFQWMDWRCTDAFMGFRGRSKYTFFCAWAAWLAVHRNRNAACHHQFCSDRWLLVKVRSKLQSCTRCNQDSRIPCHTVPTFQGLSAFKTVCVRSLESLVALQN